MPNSNPQSSIHIPQFPLKLLRPFYSRPALKVASDLLGKVLVRRWKGRNLAGMIVETEAYDGKIDRACHAHLENRSR